MLQMTAKTVSAFWPKVLSLNPASDKPPDLYFITFCILLDYS